MVISTNFSCFCLSIFRLHPQNVLGVRSFADQYMCSGLVEATNKYLQKHFKEVVRTDEFLTLKKSDVLDILGRDELNVHSEEQVLYSYCWVGRGLKIT